MIDIRQIDLAEIELPLKEPFRISSGVATTRRILLVRLTDAEGLTVWAECVAGDSPNYSPETVDTCRLALTQWVGPRVLATTYEEASSLHWALQRDFRGHRMAKAAVEMGAWCLQALQNEQSLSHTLGGTRERIPVGVSIGIQDDAESLVQKAQDAYDAGYQKIKIKIQPGADLEYLDVVRDTLGDEAPLMADANSAYTLADIDTLLSLDELGLIMIEQPLQWDDIARHADLQARLDTPVCLDESITSLERVEDMLTLRAGRIVNIKPGRVGGFQQALAIHDLCERSGIPVWCGGMLESGVGRAYNVALASLRNFVIPGDLSPSARYWERDIVIPEWTMDGDGMVDVPTGHGLGVEVDENRIKKLTVWKTTLKA